MGRPAGSKNRPRVADTSLLTDEEKASLRQEAQIKVLAEQKKLAKDAYLEQQLDEARMAGGLDEPTVAVMVSIPEFAANITIDGTIYFHGREYTVPQGRADVILEVMDRSWAHERETMSGHGRWAPTKRRDVRISPRGTVSV